VSAPEGVLVLGATSALAQAALRHLPSSDRVFLLVGRNDRKLDAVASDLRVRGALRVETLVVDLVDHARHAELLREAERRLPGIEIALLAYGTLGDQRQCEASFAAAERELSTNFLSVVSLLTLLGNYLEARRRGCIVVLSSVAGDRARRSNYVYGTAKGATSMFLDGLRARLAAAGVAVLTIKPGPVDTPMTAHLPRSALLADADRVGRGIARAIARRGPNVVYLPWFWRWIMLVVRVIPERIFWRLPL